MCKDIKPFDYLIANFLSSHIGRIIGKVSDINPDLSYEFAVAYETTELEDYFSSLKEIDEYFHEIPSSYRWKMEDTFQIDYKYNYFRPFDVDEILRIGRTKTEIELLISAEKYNL